MQTYLTRFRTHSGSPKRRRGLCGTSAMKDDPTIAERSLIFHQSFRLGQLGCALRICFQSITSTNHDRA